MTSNIVAPVKVPRGGPPRTYTTDLKTGRELCPDVWFVWDPSTPDKGQVLPSWSVEVSMALQLLGLLHERMVSYEEARAVLEGAIEQLMPSGCCPQCDESIPAHQAALRAYALAQHDFVERVRSSTGSCCLHSTKCAVADTDQPVHPGTLQEFVHGHAAAGSPR